MGNNNFENATESKSSHVKDQNQSDFNMICSESSEELQDENKQATRTFCGSGF